MMAAMSRAAEQPVGLRHVVIVGGLLEEWNSLGDVASRDRIIEYGKVVEHAGASWLTIRPLDRIAPPHGGTPASITRVGGCTGVVDPQTDGRARLVRPRSRRCGIAGTPRSPSHHRRGRTLPPR